MAEGNRFQTILDSIKSSETVEDRIQLFNDLVTLEMNGASDSECTSLIKCLTTFWEDFTCLDVTQCMLNGSILQVALKHMDICLSGCMPQILSLGAKASVWCGKHLKMSLLSTEDSQEEEHSSVFYKLLLEILRFTASTFSALLKFPDFGDKELMNIVETFTIEALNLTKDSISEAKQKIPSFGPDILKVAHTLIDAVIKLCKGGSELVNWDTSDANVLSLDRPTDVKHAINITKCAIDKLSQIGVIAANDGGNSVNILNVSWKGVVSLLQTGGGRFADVNVTNIVLTLLALITEPLKCAAESWSSSLRETVSVTEAKRVFVPVKFFLINAVKICSMYPHQAYTVYKEITHTVLMITSFRIFIGNENLLKCASSVITDLLEETTLDLVLSLLHSDQLKLKQKLEVLDSLFTTEGVSEGPTFADCNIAWVSEIFCSSCEGMDRARILIISRVALFINFLRYSFRLDEDIKVSIVQKLHWILDILSEEDVYCHMLVLQLPLLYGSGKTAQLVWQPMFSSLLQAFKTFMIVIYSSTAWGELESFLLENFFHPHFLCWEVIMECWCFVLRHAETQMASSIITKLCSLLKVLASSKSVFLSYSSFRKLARSICLLLTHGAESMVNQVYMSLVGDGRSESSLILCFSLLTEGFPFDLLTDELRNNSIQRILSDYFDFIDNFDETTLFIYYYFNTILAIFCSQVGLSDIDARTLKFLVSITCNYKSSEDKAIKDQCLRLFSETLGIISYLKHLYASNDIGQVIKAVENIFISDSEPPANLYKCKPNLAHFMSGLIHMEMLETDDDAKSRAVWELYHCLLRERHWAFIHLAMTAFGYFAARTKCNQLWRFVPQDAALAYDIVSGVEANKERFMAAFRTFLNKETALLTVAPCPDQLELLVREGLMLKQMVHKFSAIAEERQGFESMEIDDKNQSNKKRKLPDGISRGVELLKSGLKILGDGLSQWQPNQFDTNELHVKCMTQISQLEDVISHFEELAGSSEVQ
ncbi:uncharacterized protein LOC107466474 [Arachis duranensis]|uniref:Uncharacterized protein LOC107466474 n=1 Tax=Arachis duranensis TaxID=130453 RepID=A0A9C6T5X2_ARADU|nr:uncharacterized protein LOC107466474 [Arachis duranensis]